MQIENYDINLVGRNNNTSKHLLLHVTPNGN